MKKRILPLAALVLITASLLLCMAFKSEIKAFITALTHTKDELWQMQQQNAQQMQETVFKLTDISFGSLSASQAAALDTGQKQEADAINIILGRTAAPTPASEYDKNKNRVIENIAAVYVLRDLFTYKLDSLFEQAKAEYLSLSPSARQSSSELSRLMTKYGDIAKELENQCNDRMDTICTELDTLLPLINASSDIVKEIKYFYAQEKHLRKSYYMDIYTGMTAGL